MILEIQQFTNVNVLLSFLVITLIGVIRYLYIENKGLNKNIQDKNKEHLEDVKLFDNENKKSNKELLDILNKLYLSMEKSKLDEMSKGNEVLNRLKRVLDLLENKIDRN